MYHGSCRCVCLTGQSILSTNHVFIQTSDDAVRRRRTSSLPRVRVWGTAPRQLARLTCAQPAHRHRNRRQSQFGLSDSIQSPIKYFQVPINSNTCIILLKRPGSIGQRVERHQRTWHSFGSLGLRRGRRRTLTICEGFSSLGQRALATTRPRSGAMRLTCCAGAPE